VFLFRIGLRAAVSVFSLAALLSGLELTSFYTLTSTAIYEQINDDDDDDNQPRDYNFADNKC